LTDNPPVARWTTLPRFDGLLFSIDQETTNSAGLMVGQLVELSASYVATTGATSAVFDTDLPGYDPAWQVDVTLPWNSAAKLTRIDSGDTLTSYYVSRTLP
jgi:hypothetical protein